MGKLIIKNNESRLDLFLTEQVGQCSRSQWQKIISAGLVKVNQKEAKSSTKLLVGDLVSWPIPRSINLVKLDQSVNQAQSVARSPLRIVVEQPGYLVVNKPAGLLVHDAHWPSVRPTLVAKLVKKYPELVGVGENPTRPGIVHRLDKDVSGLMVVARTNEMFALLKRQFQYRTAKRHYQALVYGVLSQPEGTIDFKLARSTSGRKMAARPTSQVGKKALTEYRVTKQWQNYSLLAITIKTGRTHQVRAHLAALGHPLVGDDWYGTNKTKLKNKQLDLGRVFLVASQLSFLDDQKIRQTFSARLPAQLNNLLKEIK